MDRVAYLAMTGAKHALLKQASTAHNLANASTPGYRAETNSFRALAVFGGSMPTRTYAVDSTTGSRFIPGPMMQTGKELDLSIQTQGWFAIQTPNGEAYTRAGGFIRNSEGILSTAAGLPLLGRRRGDHRRRR